MGYRAAPNGIKNSKGQDKYKQGKYNLINQDKYCGDPTCIWFRSGWEYKLYRWVDVNDKVLKWNVEGITIPYQMEENGKWKTLRYHPDIYCEIQKGDGTTDKVVIEIKPHAETIPPVMSKNVTAKTLETHEYRLKMYLKNVNKWTAAKEYFEKR